MKSIAIMQPSFLPWIGYFALIARVDEFIIFDNVQFEKRSWQQRNKIKTVNGPIWLSVPVSSKGKQDQLIQDVEILYEGCKNPLDKIKKSIEMSYRKTPFYAEYSNDFFCLLDRKPRYIANLNEDIILWACQILNIKTPLIRSSTFDVSGSKDALLLDICQHQGATHYISPPGSKVYMGKSKLFENARIDITYHDYIHPEYSQFHDGFEPYMCILDLLFNEGEKSLSIIKKGFEEVDIS